MSKPTVTMMPHFSPMNVLMFGRVVAGRGGREVLVSQARDCRGRHLQALVGGRVEGAVVDAAGVRHLAGQERALLALAVRPWVAAKLGVAPLTNAMLVARTTADSVAVGRSQPRQRDLPVKSSHLSPCLPSLSFVLLLLTWRAVAGLR